MQSTSGEEQLLGTLVEALPSIPGVCGCVVCLRGRISAGSGTLRNPPVCQDPSGACQAVEQPCPVGSVCACEVQSLRIGNTMHGIVAIDVSAETEFAPYRPLLVNLGRLFALRLENASMAAQLEHLNHLLQGQLRAHRSLLRRAETAYVASRQELARVKRDFEDRVHERTRELEEANAELEAFSYSVSHDLREPLRAVDGFSLALMEDFGARIPPEASRFLRSIRSGAQRMETLINHLLTFSRLSNVPVKKQPIPLAELIAEVRAELQPTTLGRQIEFQLGHLPECRGDYTLIRQVWMNLLSNAIKYTRTRDRAEIEIGCRLLNGETAYFIRDKRHRLRHAPRQPAVRRLPAPAPCRGV